VKALELRLVVEEIDLRGRSRLMQEDDSFGFWGEVGCEAASLRSLFDSASEAANMRRY
jgi:hypothetical protein